MSVFESPMQEISQWIDYKYYDTAMRGSFPNLNNKHFPNLFLLYKVEIVDPFNLRCHVILRLK